MQMSSFDKLEKSFDFKPIHQWPEALPAIAWRNWLVTGFSRTHGEVLDLQHKPFIDVFCACYPKLTLPELSRFYGFAQKDPEFLSASQLNLEQFLRSYDLRLNQNLDLILTFLARTPFEFQQWCSQKDIGAKDLAPLRSLRPQDDVKPLLTQLAELKPSKSVGAQILELAVDLHLSGKSSLPSTPEMDAGDWLKQLRSLRYPMSHQADQLKSAMVQRLPWPRQTQARWTRQGDETGIEIKFVATTHQDFIKKLDGLMHVQTVISKNSEGLWNN